MSLGQAILIPGIDTADSCFEKLEVSVSGAFETLQVKDGGVFRLLEVKVCQEVLFFGSMDALKNSDDFEDVKLAFVDGELFIYDEDDSSHPDQLDTVCPIDNSALHTDDNVVFTGAKWAPNALPHTNILFRTLGLTDITDGSLTSTDLNLHGAKFDNGTGETLMQHEGGTMLHWSAQNVFEMSYRYASSAGRWKRIRTGGDSPVAPSNLGATGSGDEGHLIQWTFEFANNLGRDVFIDQEYTYSALIRPHHYQLVYGKGRFYPALSVDSNTVMDRYKSDFADALYLAVQNSAYIGLPNRDEGGGGLRLRDLQINGNAYDFDWDNKWNDAYFGRPKGEIFNLFRDTPAGQGLGGGTHESTSNSNIRHELKNILGRNFPSTVLAGQEGSRAAYMRNARLGPNIVINRFSYSWFGHIFNFDCYGAYGANHVRWGTCHCFGFTYRPDGIALPDVFDQSTSVVVQQ